MAVPHTWSTYETTGATHPFIRDAAETDNPFWWRGWDWYRKRFAIKKVHSGRKVFLEFDGVQKFCRIWLNGALVGEYAGVLIADDYNFCVIEYNKTVRKRSH